MYCKFCEKLTKELGIKGVPSGTKCDSDNAVAVSLSCCPVCHVVYAE